MLTALKQLYEKYFATEATVYLLVTCGVLLLVLLTDIVGLLAPFIAAFVIAYLLQGTVSFITQRLPVSDFMVMVCVFVLFLVLFISLVLLIVPLLYQQTIAFVTSLPQLVPQWLAVFNEQIKYVPGLESFIKVSRIENHIIALLDSSLQMVVTYSVGNADSFLLFLAYLVIIPTVVFFMLKDKQPLIAHCQLMLPADKHTQAKILNMLQEVDTQLMHYIRGKFFECAIIGVATYIICVWFGLQYAELLSFMVGLSVFIPYFGIVIVTVPLTLIAVSQFGFGADLYWLLGLYTVVQLLDANVLVPVLFSEVVQIHPILILLVIVVAAGVWGVWGVFFAIPLAVCIKALVSNWPFGNQST